MTQLSKRPDEGEGQSAVPGKNRSMTEERDGQLSQPVGGADLQSPPAASSPRLSSLLWLAGGLDWLLMPLKAAVLRL